MIEMGQLTILVFHKIDRINRTLIDYNKLMDKCIPKGIKLISVIDINFILFAEHRLTKLLKSVIFLDNLSILWIIIVLISLDLIKVNKFLYLGLFSSLAE